YVHRKAPALEPFFSAWWEECIVPRIPEQHRAFFADLYAYDWATKPRLDATARELELAMVELDGQQFYGPETYAFSYDVVSALAQLKQGAECVLPEAWKVELYY